MLPVDPSGDSDHGAPALQPAGARPAPAAAGMAHRELTVVTLEQRRDATMEQLRAVLEASRPGVVRVKGRLVVDGGDHLTQLTPTAVDITPSAPGPTSLTVIAVDGSAAQPIVDLVTGREAASSKG